MTAGSAPAVGGIDRTPDVLRRLRAATAQDHAQVESALDLLDPGLDRARLIRAMTALHGFWAAAEDGLEGWAGRHPDDAVRVDWPRRRRAHLYAADLRALGAHPTAERPLLPDVVHTDEALGRLYVLEGATLGGAFIHRHLAALPALASLRLRAFSPYGERTGVMWHAYRRATRAHVADRGDPARVVAAARDTFAALARWVEAAQRTTAWPVSGTAAIDLRVALGDVAGAVPLVAGSGPAGPRIARAAEEVTPPER